MESLQQLQAMKEEVRAISETTTFSDSTPNLNGSVYETPLYRIVGIVAWAMGQLDLINEADVSEDERQRATTGILDLIGQGQEMLPVKLENIAKVIKSIKRQREAIKAERSELGQKIDQLDRKEDALKTYAMRCLEGIGGRLKTDTMSITRVCKKLDKLVIDDEQLLPTAERFWKRRAPEPIAAEFKKAINAGEQIQGAHLEDSVYLLIK
jgi:hypothetical protein